MPRHPLNAWQQLLRQRATPGFARVLRLAPAFTRYLQLSRWSSDAVEPNECLCNMIETCENSDDEDASYDLPRSKTAVEIQRRLPLQPISHRIIARSTLASYRSGDPWGSYTLVLICLLIKPSPVEYSPSPPQFLPSLAPPFPGRTTMHPEKRTKPHHTE